MVLRVHWLLVFGRNYEKEKSMCIQQCTFSISMLTRYLGCSRGLQCISVPVFPLCLWKSLAKLLSAQELCIPLLSPLSVLHALFNHSSWGGLLPPRWMVCWFIALSLVHMEEELKDVRLFFFPYPSIAGLFCFRVFWFCFCFSLVHNDMIIDYSTSFV